MLLRGGRRLLGGSGLLCRGLRDLLLRGGLLGGDILHHRLSGDALCLLLHTALGLQLRNAGVVGLNGRLSLADPSAGGGIGPLRGGAPLRVVQPAQLQVRLLDGVLLAHITGLQLRDLRQLL